MEALFLFLLVSREEGIFTFSARMLRRHRREVVKSVPVLNTREGSSGPFAFGDVDRFFMNTMHRALATRVT